MHLTLIPHQQTYLKCLVCYKYYKTFVTKAKIFTGAWGALFWKVKVMLKCSKNNVIYNLYRIHKSFIKDLPYKIMLPISLFLIYLGIIHIFIKLL